MARFAIAGRAQDIPKDVADAFEAIITGDSDALGEVLSRRGEGLTASVTDITRYEATARTGMGEAPPAGATGILAAAMKRGEAAKGYRWTATGPDYYDCSGLMWRACQDAKVYDGPRFVTHNVANLKAFVRVDDPRVGDMVVWPTHHMGVVTGKNKYYSAMSVKSGIGESTISGYGKPHIFIRPRSTSA